MFTVSIINAIDFLKCLVFLWSSAEVDEPHIKSGSVAETDNIKYTPRGYEKVYYHWRLWGIRPGISSRSKMAWESKERRLACIYIVIRGWGQGKHCWTLEGTCMVRIPHRHQRKIHLGFLISLYRCGSQRKRRDET